MERKDEIVIILNNLLMKLKNDIVNHHHSNDMNKIVENANNSVKISKDIEKYVNEYKEIENSDTF